MLGELESTCLQVALVPERRRTHECGMIRVAVSQNALWYRKFCDANRSSRKRKNNAPDTCIKRAHTLRILRRLVAGLPTKGYYVDQIMRIARLRISTNPF